MATPWIKRTGIHIYESFDTADSLTLGPLLSWTEVQGSGEVSGNRARMTSGTINRNRANHDLGTTSMYVQGISSSTDNTGLNMNTNLAALVSGPPATNATLMMLVCQFLFTSGDMKFFRTVNGTSTLITTFTDVFAGLTDTDYFTRFECRDTGGGNYNMKGYINRELVGEIDHNPTAADALFVPGTYSGYALQGANDPTETTWMDDFRAGTL